MIRKVLFIGDYYRGNQDRNVQVLYYLISPIFKTVDIEVKVFNDTTKYANQDRWVDALNGYGESFLNGYDLDDTLVISFEINKLDKDFLNKKNIPWIDIEIHPIRFLDDLYFSITSSFDFDFNSLAISENSIQLYANALQIPNINRNYNLNNDSLLILGQEPKDKSIFFDNKFKTLLGYTDELDKLVKKYNNIYYRPHPFKTNQEVNEIILEKYNASILSDINYYDLISSNCIKGVCSISSSTLHEANYFNKEITFLEKRVKQFSRPIKLDELLKNSSFWNKILVANQRIVDFYLPENKCRDFFSYWSYETNLKRIEAKANEAQAKANEAEVKANEAQSKANEAQSRANKAQARTIEAEARANEAWHNFHIIENSNSWKMTKPLRLVKPFVKKSFLQFDKGISKAIHFFILKKINQPTIRPTDEPKKLFIDCSFIYSTNLNTGIQRVVRNIVNNIEKHAKEKNLELVTVALVNGFIIKIDMNQVHSDNQEQKSKFLNTIDKIQKKIKLHITSYKEVEVIYEDDILLMLDSTWHLDIWPSVRYAKNRGAKVIGVIYDLIPISHPQFCDDNLVKLFADWYDKSLNYFDGYIAISQTVMLDVQKYLKSKGVDIDKYDFDYFKLGSDFKESTRVTLKVCNELQELYKNNKSIYLIVSTIEPRKNHQYLFDTFKELWKSNIDVTLVIVGRVGWKTEKLIEEMIQHNEYRKRLWIFNDLDDNELSFCYENSKALLFPSYIEGYGLPIIESLQNGLPVLASDTPIHREVGGDMIDYFDIGDITSLSGYIENIEKNKIKLKEVVKSDVEILSWSESAKELFEKIS